MAETVHAMLGRGGLPSGLDPQRGFDHGTFTLMHTMYPEAEMPLVQLSLRASLDPGEHIKVGELIAPLRDQGILIVGSGFSFHNGRHILNGAGAASSAAFDEWLDRTLVIPSRMFGSSACCIGTRHRRPGPPILAKTTLSP